MSDKEIPTCCDEVVENEAGGKTFYFCRGCGTEPVLKKNLPPPITKKITWDDFNGGFLIDKDTSDGTTTVYRNVCLGCGSSDGFHFNGCQFLDWGNP